MPKKDSLAILQRDVIACQQCPRLLDHCRTMAQVKRRAFRDQEYWGKPLPGWGDPQARVLLLGLAPAAHGGNRTGRMFTGDRSGEFLFGALHRANFARQSGSLSRDDGQQLLDVYMSNAVRCAPPDNRPDRTEITACRSYLRRELLLLTQLQLVVALGKLAFDAFLTIQQEEGLVAARSIYAFGHNHLHRVGNLWLVSSYHPSQQNTSTGRLTATMMDQVFSQVRKILK